jgi:hypothetical protein
MLKERQANEETVTGMQMDVSNMQALIREKVERLEMAQQENEENLVRIEET